MSQRTQCKQPSLMETCFVICMTIHTVEIEITGRKITQVVPLGYLDPACQLGLLKSAVLEWMPCIFGGQAQEVHTIRYSGWNIFHCNTQGEDRFSGKACECDSSICESGGTFCSGPSQGECTCDGCRCLIEPTTGIPYNGTYCECSPNTQTCRDHSNSTVCAQFT